MRIGSSGFLTFTFMAMLAASAPAAGAYEAVAVEDGGVIAGKVVFNGRVPSKKVIPTKDQNVCGGIRDRAEVVLGPDKGVRYAVVFLKNVESGKDWGEGGSLKTPVLDQEKCMFEPHVQVIPAGELEVVNSDPVLHNTHGFYGRRTAFNMALPNQGQKIMTELERPGVVRVECDAHGWMLAWIYVADSPYYVVTADDGTFEITDIPPGDYTLVAWQEYTGPVEMPVTVGTGETAEITIELKKQ